jgi:hypothetical protein
LTATLALIWGSAAWAADRFTARDNRQTRRIHQGIRSGQITFPEARRLKREQRHIDRAYCRGLADGHLNRNERRRLDKMQNHASRNICRAKHNRARHHLKKYCRYGKRRPYYHHRGVVHGPHKCRCYPATHGGYFNGYAFSAGVSDVGWQFAFSSRNNR